MWNIETGGGLGQWVPTTNSWEECKGNGDEEKEEEYKI